jgi:hypothetical protein
VSAIAIAKRDQFLNFREGEAEILRSLDETNQSNRVGWIFPIPRGGSVRLFKERASLVVPNCRYADTGSFSEPADRKSNHRDPLSRR